MKNSLLLFLFLLSQFCFAQNLVPNPSFEDTVACPNYISQINRAIGWYVTRDSPDYFNACSTDTFPSGQHIVNVPLNWAGYRTPASGNAYAGFITSWANNEARENIGSQLITPLQIGIRYYASFKVSLGGKGAAYNYCGTNKLGILFSVVHYDSLSPAPICSNCAQICSDSIVTDTLNWTRITGSFVADSNYAFISIGRHNLNSLTNFTQVAGFGYNAYYFIDDVCISADSAYTYTYGWTGINNLSKEEIISVYPNPTSAILNLSFQNFRDAEVSIYDGLGRKVFSSTAGNQNTLTLNLGAFSPGVYLLKLVSEKDGKAVVRKLIKL
ncbi:MAG TPA: T9SS type A sorting domain-containing protein [Bacteroidia bacterium]|nr:T9SS type A sorting domain-containing protein [Bacteroidia bacterium]